MLCHVAGTLHDLGLIGIALLHHRTLQVAATGLGAIVLYKQIVKNGGWPQITSKKLAKGARGYHIIVSSTMVGGAAVERRSAALARDLRTELDATRTMPRSTYIGGGTAIHARTDIAGLNLINVPGVMLELGNMRNASDLALQRSPQWRATVAKALAAGAVAALA